jgi:hypothetical protein
LAPSLSLDPMCRQELTLSPGPAKLSPTLDPAHWMEQILSTSPAKLTLDPAHQPELSLSPRLAELTLDSTYH